MSKLNILNLVLFIVVISLAVVIYFSETTNTQLERLTDTSINAITTINIQHNKNQITLAKDSSQHWRITKPVQIPANDFRINTLLKLLNAPVHSHYSTDEVNLSDTGLAESTTTISFDKHNIVFGVNNSATSLRYVQLNNSIFTIEDVYFPLVSSNFSTLVSLHLLPNDSHIEKLILKNQTISKNDNGLWQSNIDITADNINKAIDDWSSAQAFGAHKYLERENLGELFVYLADTAEPISFLITDTDPWLIFARPELGLEYHLDIEAYNNLIEPK